MNIERNTVALLDLLNVSMPDGKPLIDAAMLVISILNEYTPASVTSVKYKKNNAIITLAATRQVYAREVAVSIRMPTSTITALVDGEHMVSILGHDEEHLRGAGNMLNACITYDMVIPFGEVHKTVPRLIYKTVEHVWLASSQALSDLIMSKFVDLKANLVIASGDRRIPLTHISNVTVSAGDVIVEHGADCTVIDYLNGVALKSFPQKLAATNILKNFSKILHSEKV